MNAKQKAQFSNQSKNTNDFADLLGPLPLSSASQKQSLSAIQSQSQAKSTKILSDSPLNQSATGGASKPSYVSSNIDNNPAAFRPVVGSGTSLDLPGKTKDLLNSNHRIIQSSSTPTLLQSMPVRNPLKVDPFLNLTSELKFQGIENQPKILKQGPLAVKNASCSIGEKPFISDNISPSNIGIETIDDIKKISGSAGRAWEDKGNTAISQALPDVFDVEYFKGSSKPAVTIVEDDILGPLSLPIFSNGESNMEDSPSYGKLKSNKDAKVEPLISMSLEGDNDSLTLQSKNDDHTFIINPNTCQDIKSHSSPQDAYKSLLNMGFDRDEVENALFSSSGNFDGAFETLMGNQEFRNSASFRESSKIGGVSKLVGSISKSVFKNAKSVFNASRQKVEEVFSVVQEKESTKVSYQDVPEESLNINEAKKGALFAPDVSSTEKLGFPEIPLQRNKNSPSSVPLLIFGVNEVPVEQIQKSTPVQKIPNSTTAEVVATSEEIELSHKLRVAGNDLFKKGQFADAENEYTKAIAILPPRHNFLLPLYNNRAACRLKNGDNRGAIADCDIILQQNPTELKALLRRATALEALEYWERARDDYRTLIGLDPSVKGVSMGLARSNAALQPKLSKKIIDVTTGGASSEHKPVDKSVRKAVDEAVQKLRHSNEANEQLESSKFAASQAVNEKIEAWKKNKETNIRALLSSLEQILWPECSWKPCNLGELISPAQVKSKYIRAVSKLHPDKLGTVSRLPTVFRVKNPMFVRKATTKEDIYKCYKIRIEVFVGEQNIPLCDEIDIKDPDSTHFLGYFQGEPAGTARLVKDQNHICHLGRLAVIKSARNHGLATLLLENVHSEAINQGFTKSVIHAQRYLKDFYLKAGYVVDSDTVFIEDGLEHLLMSKDIVYQKMVQSEFLQRAINRLEIQVDQCHKDKLADSIIIEDLKKQALILENDNGSKAKIINDLNMNLARAKGDLIKGSLNNQKLFSNLRRKLEEISSLDSQFESFSKSFEMKSDVFDKRIEILSDRVGIVNFVKSKSNQKISNELEELKSEVKRLRLDRKLLVEQLMQIQDNEVSKLDIKNASKVPVDKSLDRLELLESLSEALLEL